jgi:hypothetical protein
MSYYLSIVVCFRDESVFLAEWIDFHLGAGVEHFYFYDNFSADNYSTVLQPYIDRKIVTLISWPVVSGQKSAYSDAVNRFKKQSRWMAFIDMDEFLLSPLDQDVRRILQDYEQYSAVAVNWVNYGSSGLIESPKQPVTYAYLLRGELDVVVPYPNLLKSPRSDPALLQNYRPLNTHIKTIANPLAVAGCSNPHYLKYTQGFAVSEQGSPVRGAWSDTVSVKRLRLSHYWSKSREDMAQKIARGRADGGKLRTWEEFEERDRHMNEIADLITRERFDSGNAYQVQNNAPPPHGGVTGK